MRIRDSNEIRTDQAFVKALQRPEPATPDNPIIVEATTIQIILDDELSRLNAEAMEILKTWRWDSDKRTRFFECLEEMNITDFLYVVIDRMQWQPYFGDPQNEIKRMAHGYQCAIRKAKVQGRLKRGLSPHSLIDKIRMDFF